MMESNCDMSLFKDYGPDMEPERLGRFNYLWTADFQFGDWMTPSGQMEADGTWHYWSAENNQTFVANCFISYSAILLAKIADVIGKPGDAAYYNLLYGKFKDAILREFYDTGYIPESRYQGVLVLALRSGLYPEGEREVPENRLVEVVEKYDDHKLNTGFASMEYLMGYLADAGRPDLAYDVLLSEEFPYYKYMIDRDATTIWETWLNISKDGTVNTDSYTQYCLGSAGRWFMSGIGGIAPAEPGYKKILIAPVIDPKHRVTNANAFYETKNGAVKTSWKVSGRTVTLSVEIPVNTTAEIRFAGSDRQPEFIGSGRYEYTYELTSCMP